LDRHPQVRTYFADVNLRAQAVMLTMALKLVEQHYVHHYPAMRNYLKILGRRHRERLKIPAENFAPFGDCLLVTIQEFHGSEWDPGLEDQWRAAIDEAIAVMLED
jgi:hemoglobin-like flavoprotein